MSQHKAIIRQRHGEFGSLTDDKSSQLPSETIPNEAMTIPYLLSRYVQGIPLNVQHHGVDYQTENFDSPDWEKLKNADLTDHEDLQQQLQEIEDVHKEQVKRRQAKKKEQETTVSANTPPKAGTAEAGEDRHAGDGAARPAE